MKDLGHLTCFLGLEPPIQRRPFYQSAQIHSQSHYWSSFAVYHLSWYFKLNVKYGNLGWYLLKTQCEVWKRWRLYSFRSQSTGILSVVLFTWQLLGQSSLMWLLSWVCWWPSLDVFIWPWWKELLDISSAHLNVRLSFLLTPILFFLHIVMLIGSDAQTLIVSWWDGMSIWEMP